jgi:hypothetical protein
VPGVIVPVTNGGVYEAGYGGGQGCDFAGQVDEDKRVFHNAFL